MIREGLFNNANANVTVMSSERLSSSEADKFLIVVAYIYVVNIFLTFINCIYLIRTRKNNLDDLTGRLVLYLCLSDFLSNVLNLVVGYNIFAHFMNNSMCHFVGYVTMAASHWSSLWTCVIGVHLLRAVNGKREIAEYKYHTVCWGVPLLYDIIPLAMGAIESICYVASPWAVATFENAPRVLLFTINFVLMGMVFQKMEALRKAFSWSITEKKHTARRRLFLMQACLIPCMIGTIFMLSFSEYDWPFYLGLYMSATQGITNVLATGERKITLSCRNLVKKLCKRKQKVEIEITPSSDVSEDVTV